MSIQNIKNKIEPLMSNKIAIIIICITLIMLVYYITHYNTSTYEDYLYGFWVAEADAFCEEAEIDSALLFIGERIDNVRECYLLITPDISNQSFTLEHKSAMGGPGVGDYVIKGKVNFEEENLWNDEVNVKVDMRDGTIRIYSGDTLHLRAQKQHDTTNISKYLDEE